VPEVLILGEGWFPDRPSGLTRYVRTLLEHIPPGSHAKAVVTGPASDPAANVIVAGDQAQPLATRLVRTWRAAAEAGRTADIVDIHFPLYAVLPTTVGPLRRIPTVVHFHGPWADERMTANETPAANKRVKRMLERGVYRSAVRCVVLSGAFKRLLIERYGVAPWQIDVIPPAVEAERFSPGPRDESRRVLGLPIEGDVVLAARRLVPRVGIDILLEAWADLGGGERTLVVVGDGPERHTLESRAQSLGIAGSVRFLGSVDEEHLVHCYRAADVCVVPSVALEGFGLTILESLACGVPVIASDIDGASGTLRRFDPGSLVPPADPRPLAARIRGALDASDPLPPAADCRRFAECFSTSAFSARHDDVYQRAVRRSSPRVPRVVVLDHLARLSGAEIGLLRLAPALDGVDTHVILGEDGQLVTELVSQGVSVEVLPMDEAARDVRRAQLSAGRLPVGAGLRSLGYAARVTKRLRALRPDVVHLYSMKSQVYGSVAAKTLGIPTVWHAHNRVAPEYLPGPAVRVLRAMGERLPAAMVANSESTMETLGDPARHGVISRIIPYPLPPLAPPTPRRDNGTLSVGMVGRICEWKGQHVFIEAFHRAFPDGDAKAVIVGAPMFGEEPYLESLHALVDRLGLGGRVEFTGFRQDVAAELGRLDVLVHASVIPEPFGQVVTEGMAAGLPVVAADAGGPTEILTDGVTGVLYPMGDAEALAAALERLAANPDLRARIGHEARRAAAAYGPEAIGRQFVDLYREVIERTRRS